MTTVDGTVLGGVRVFAGGSPQRCWNLVLVAEGYMRTQRSRFSGDVADFTERLLATPPFDELRSAINVYRIDVASRQSGADDPTDCGGPGTTAATYFDATFCGDGTLRRLLTVDDGLVLDVVAQEVPQAHAVVVVVNTSRRGGAGGNVAVTSRSSDWHDIILHELGHSAFGLADEYPYYEGCGVDEDHDQHPGAEPSEPNVTRSPSGHPWRALRTPGVMLPTMSNPDCGECDDRPSTVRPGTVGAFEGAHYYHCGIYRPEFDCRMKNSSVEFCAVCRCRIWSTLAVHMPAVYVGNARSKELHDVHSRNRNCQLCEIRSRVYFRSLEAAHAEGYDHCHWCLGGSTR